MKEKICHIVCAGGGAKQQIKIKNGDLLLVADGGYDKIKNSNLKIDYLIGDFDSITNLPTNQKVIKLPVEKDVTDTYYCINQGMKLGYKVFYLYFATGGKRIDHTIANLQILNYLANNDAQGYIFSGNQVVTAIKNTCLKFSEKASGFISVFASTTTCKSVKISGLKYQFNGEITNDFALGVSNEFCGKNSSIEASDGMLTVVFDKKCLKYINLL